MERYTIRSDDGEVMMNCQICNASCTKTNFFNCTALYCRDRLKKRLAEVEDILNNLAGQANLTEGILIDRLRELVEADRDGRCVVYKPGYPVVSKYHKDEDGLYIREISGVVSKEEYEDSIKIPDSLSPEGKKLYYEILTGDVLKGEQHATEV